MASHLGNGLRFAINIHDFPDGHPMPEHMGFAPAGGVPEPDAGILFLQRLFLQVKAAQGGDLQMTALGLAGEQRRMAFFDSTGLHNRRHRTSVVYSVNDVKAPEPLHCCEQICI